MRPAAYVVGLLAAALFFNYVDRGLLPTAAHLIDGELKLTEAQLGLLLSAFFWTYSCAQIPMGWLAERLGAQRVLAAGLATWAVATILTGFAHSFGMLLALRLLLGLGESVGFPSVSKLLAIAVPVSRLGTANGVVAFAYLFGPAVGTYGGGLLMAFAGGRSAFVLVGALSLLGVLPWSKVRLPRAAGGPAAPVPSFPMILRRPALWGTSLGLFSSNYVFYFMLSWLPFYLVRERGFSTAEMAQLAGGAYLVNALSAVLTGVAIDRFIGRGGSADRAYKSVMAAAHLGAVLCMLAMAGGPRWLALAAMFLYQALTGASSPGVYAMPQILAGPLAAGRWVGIQNSIGNFAGVVAPALTGLIVERTGHFTAAFVLAAGVSVLGLIGWLPMVPKLAELHWERPAAPAMPPPP